MKNARARQTLTWILACSAGMFLLAYMAHFRQSVNDTPRQGWWNERGPVVPHDTFPGDCSLCHESGGWNRIKADFAFDHAAETGHELVGAHQAAECLRCHNDKGPVQDFVLRGCAGCHEDVHRGGLGSDCSSCHNESDWRPDERIASHQETRFPLVGAHATAPCWACHPGADTGVFRGADTACESCHLADLAQATNPDHVAAGFTTDCDRCHIPTSWGGAGFKHPGFPLSGAHARADCTQCHPGGVFSGTPSDCYSCHSTEYASTTNPNHQQAGFPTSCETCHSTSTWLGARFNHNRWPLTGAHASTDCSECHIGGVFAGTPTNCVDCHLPEYQATNDPDHEMAGFPTSCDACHTTSSWDGVRFNHRLPISSGPHSNLSCVDCHTVPMNYVLFSCIDCHEHRQSAMDSEHDDVRNYVWETSACYSCHPNGRE